MEPWSNRSGVLIRRESDLRDLSLFTHEATEERPCEDTAGSLPVGWEPSPAATSACALTWDLLASRTMGRNVCCLSHPVSGPRWWQLRQMNPGVQGHPKPDVAQVQGLSFLCSLASQSLTWTWKSTWQLLVCSHFHSHPPPHQPIL